eukprot:CAMPEP_0198138466 /NCGR_PEP_ID=MMETSP1443-20131203/1881_1 /TAXON_ID=186043 /ORGANISM="Entomoneis sp., Strain CCMP2396" /LENGTH=339 /DNA_ID=CAMNT_0043800257 /DNA_START=269 /DNA_END=1285 /DNA_ORIENTATION=+
MGYLRSVREWAYPTRTSSAFLEKGVLTPEEYVQAGDELCFRCPTWSWESGDVSKQKSYLPPDKQYLITRNVPCKTRVEDLEHELAVLLNKNGGGDEEDAEWLMSTILQQGGPADQPENVEDDFDILDETGEVVDNPPAATTPAVEPDTKPSASAMDTDGGDDDGYADMADFEDDNVLMDDDNVAAAPTAASSSASGGDDNQNDNTLQVRTYDLSITYDKYYQTPRVWMVGASAQGQPLSAVEMMQDVMTDYANKTVTIEYHPHVAGPHASIHPCQHGKVMKRIVQNLIKNNNNSTGQPEEDSDPPTVELYLFIFLKFVNSIIPTINYDFTMDVMASTQK